MEPLPPDADDDSRSERWAEVRARIESLLDGESDAISAMATVACELHHAFAAFQWTGFYRVIAPGQLAVGPYQGGHGCLRIPFERGVCGAAARLARTQNVPDVDEFPGHIACSSSTRSELVVPLRGRSGQVIAVLDLDSDTPAAFRAVDQEAVEALCVWLGPRLG